MNSFSIKDIENMTGIKCHTLRIWEQRYDLINPKRKESKHRIYDNEDLKYILRIAHLYHSGLKISKIAALNPDQIHRLSLESKNEDEYSKVFINRLIEAAIDFDQAAFEQVLQNVFLRLGFERAMIEVIYPFLTKMGLLWMTDNVIPAQEHFSSNLIRKKMLVAIDGLSIPQPDPKRTVILFTPEGEFHEIPLLFIKYLFKKNQVPFIYFGTNVPLKDIMYYCKLKEADMVFGHIITSVRYDLNEYIEKLCGTFPDKKVVLSGPLTHIVKKQYPNLTLLKSCDEMLKFPEKLAQAHHLGTT